MAESVRVGTSGRASLAHETLPGLTRDPELASVGKAVPKRFEYVIEVVLVRQPLDRPQPVAFNEKRRFI